MELWVHRVTKAVKDRPALVAEAGPGRRQAPRTGRFISMTLVKQIWCGARGGGASLRGPQKRAGFAKWNQALGGRRSLHCPWFPAIKCRIKEETFLPSPCPPASAHQAPSRGSFQKNMEGGAFDSWPSQLALQPAQRGFGRLIKTR